MRGGWILKNVNSIELEILCKLLRTKICGRTGKKGEVGELFYAISGSFLQETTICLFPSTQVPQSALNRFLHELNPGRTLQDRGRRLNSLVIFLLHFHDNGTSSGLLCTRTKIDLTSISIAGLEGTRMDSGPTLFLIGFPGDVLSLKSRVKESPMDRSGPLIVGGQATTNARR